MEYVNQKEMVDDLMAILRPEVAMKVKGMGTGGGVQAADEGIAENLRFGGAEGSRGVPFDARRPAPGFVHRLGAKILKFIKTVPARVGGRVAACFGKVNGMEGKREGWTEGGAQDGAAEERAEPWSPDLDPAVLLCDEEDSVPSFDYSALARQDEQAWKEFNEWWDEFLKPLPFVRVDDSELLAVMEREERERENLRGVPRTGSFRSIVDFDGGDDIEWVVTEEGDFWGMLPTVTKGRVLREVERLEAAMRARRAGR